MARASSCRRGGRPQRTALDVAFAAAHGVRVDRTATAQGWEVVVRLVELGVGLGVVNDAVRLPRTLVSRPLARRPLRAGNTRGTEIARGCGVEVPDEVLAIPVANVTLPPRL